MSQGDDLLAQLRRERAERNARWKAQQKQMHRLDIAARVGMVLAVAAWTAVLAIGLWRQ